MFWYAQRSVKPARKVIGSNPIAGTFIKKVRDK